MDIYHATNTTLHRTFLVWCIKPTDVSLCITPSTSPDLSAEASSHKFRFPRGRSQRYFPRPIGQTDTIGFLERKVGPGPHIPQLSITDIEGPQMGGGALKDATSGPGTPQGRNVRGGRSAGAPDRKQRATPSSSLLPPFVLPSSFPLPSFFLLPSSFFLLPSSSFLLPPSFLPSDEDEVRHKDYDRDSEDEERHTVSIMVAPMRAKSATQRASWPRQ